MARRKSAKKAAPKKAAKKSAARIALSADAGGGAGGGGSVVVPRENVGSACQAAVSFENASSVSAVATDDSRQTFRVSWS